MKTGDAGKSDDGLLAKLWSWLGFSTTNDSTKNAAGATLAGAAIAGAASGYAAHQRHEIEKQLADSQTAVNAANAALATSKTNQAGLAGLKYTPANGMINAPWKPAPIVPPSKRTAQIALPPAAAM